MRPMISFGFFRSIAILFIALVFYSVYLHRSISTSTVSVGSKAPIVVYDWYDAPSKGRETQEAMNPSDESRRKSALMALNAIIGRNETDLSRLACPRFNKDWYGSLKSTGTSDDQARIKYFFALDLHQCLLILPSLLGSVLEAMLFLGPERCALSIVEGRSSDGTRETLQLLASEVEKIGASYFLARNDVDPLKAEDRIAALAELRNDAMKPMMREVNKFEPDSIVIFLNDVSLCTEDILELVFQQQNQGADMVCAMDWTYVGPDPTFYDVWIARTISGDSFFNIPSDGNWNSAWNLFWNNDATRSAFFASRPFQVFSCWNGAAVFTAKPFLNNQIAFRASHADECKQGEPQIFCKELWYLGYRKIGVIPAVNLEYTDDAARKVKALKGFVSTWKGRSTDEEKAFKIQWSNDPPERVKCIPSYEDQYWVPWDESLANHLRKRP